jgi:SNF2 family DNA or RNA helicase
VFRPFITLHSKELKSLRSLEAEGRETEIGKPMLEMERLRKYRVVITNYETITNYQHSFAYMPNGIPQWSAIVTDEAQGYKTPNTRISHAIKALEADFHIASTGTPVENRLLDLWNLFDALQQGLLGSAREFRRTYEDQLGTTSRGQILDELKRKLLFQRPHAFILRRNKSEIADLPPKHTKKMLSSMSEVEIGRHRELIQELRGDSHGAHHLTVLHRLSLLYQHPALERGDGEDIDPASLIEGSSKLRAVIELLHEIRRAGEKAIIFARHRPMQSILAKVTEFEFRMPVRIINGLTQRAAGSGQRGKSTRAAILDEFRKKPGFGILILSPFVAGVGLTITEANHVIHYGRWWNPAVESQATDRTYRIGQTKPVYVYLPILHDPTGAISTTFDQRLDALMERRYRLAEDFLRPLPDEDGLSQELVSELSDEAEANSGDQD